MGDLETQLRTEVIRRSQEFSPSADLGEHIGARVRRRRRQRRFVAGMVSAAVVTVVTLGALLARPSNEGSMRVGGEGEMPTTTVSTTLGTTTNSPPSTTTEPAVTSTTANPPATTSTTPPPASAIATIDADTPLRRTGIGPIRAGMTLREAEAAAAVTITPDTSMWPGGTCATAHVEGLPQWFMVELSGQPGDDPMDGVIRSVQGGRRTAEGLAVGDPIANVEGTYGSPTRTLDYPYLPNGEVFVFESGGYAYSATTDGAIVTELESGDPAWVANLEGCS